MRTAEELRALVADSLDDLELSPELGALVEPMRYAVGGKLIRPVLCLATAEALGLDAEEALPAALAIELVHSFSLVHDDLPALDDDDVRRGKPTVHAEFGERTAILVGDALLAEAFRLVAATGRPDAVVALAAATSKMIGGQHLDFEGGASREDVHRLKTAALFEAPVACALVLAGISEDERPPWLELATEVGLLFQVVDDILDADGLVQELGAEETRALADRRAARAHELLAALEVDTAVLESIVDGLATRTV